MMWPQQLDPGSHIERLHPGAAGTSDDRHHAVEHPPAGAVHVEVLIKEIAQEAARLGDPLCDRNVEFGSRLRRLEAVAQAGAFRSLSGLAWPEASAAS